MKRIQSSATLKRLLVIAFPMIISQTSDTLMLFVDRFFLSRVGEEYLAASMSGGLSQFMLGSFFIGTIGYVTAVVAQYYGAGRHEKCAEATFQAIVLSFLSYPLLLALSPLMRIFFSSLGQTALQVDLAYTYFQTLIFGIIFLILRHALAGFFIGIGRTTVVMIANAVGMFVNIPLNYVLIYGKLGFPALGLRGAAIGTVLGNMTIFIILAAFYLRGKNRADFSTHTSLHFRPKILKTLLKFGVPAGLAMFLNIAAFNLFVQSMHSYGTKVAAAVTIAFNWDVVAFLPMLGMGHAVTALVGQNVGAGDYIEARKSAFIGLKTAWVYSFSIMILFIVAARPLVGVFIPGLGSGSTEVSTMAVIMLRLASFYVLADSAQLVFTGALRGAGDTRWVMIVSVALHWAFAGVALFLIRGLEVNPVIAWLSFIGFIIVMGTSMFLRFHGGKWKDIKMIDTEAPEYPYTVGAFPEIIAEEPVEPTLSEDQ
ncbi:MAG: MATE family efflux transporter [Spirochaetia bacterium]